MSDIIVTASWRYHRAPSEYINNPQSFEELKENICGTFPRALVWCSRFNDFPTPTQMSLVVSPLLWLSAILNYVLSPIFRFTRLQTSLAPTRQNIYHLINKYRPTFFIVTPAVITSLLHRSNGETCDMTCLDLIMVGGSAVPKGLVEEVREMVPGTEVVNAYGMTEMSMIAFHCDDPPTGSCGKRMGCLQYRIINTETNEDILEPHVSGELWVRGPGVFKGYYNDPKSTERSFAEGGWFKTGDIFYRDENWNYYPVERIKSILKYKSYQIAPVEIEGVIRQLPGVFDVAVTGIPDEYGDDLPCACVIKRPGHNITAQEIKDLVKESLADVKHLSGGVIFLDELPLTPSAKVNRKKLKEIVLEMDRL
ncbi:unnamed protein product [Diatraea saccharalis]|uniref:Luciferase n=1 Tax=Diatraea saccharalis TaxID=40085 RepID=A0A9N9R847_9NEOP|nr:unnamed protein product [Diatraea saccharalis]